MTNAALMTDQIVPSLKIYGERNTGTNYLTALMDGNFNADILSGRVDDRYLPVLVTRKLRRYWPSLAHKLHEAARDRYFSTTFDQNLGWKHMNPDLERIGPSSLEDVRFVMVLKNPYAWLLSLFQRPYHVGGRDDRFEDFLDRRLAVMERRENIGPHSLTPVEVWNAKLDGYRALERSAKHAMIVQYEDFLRDEGAALDRVGRTLGLSMRQARMSINTGIKRDDSQRTRTDYADYYLKERWRDKLTAETIAKINSVIDAEAVRTVGYEII